MSADRTSSLDLPTSVDVLIVGAGPTGLAAANLLGGYGVDVLVLEREDDLSTLPRAVSVDDESMRALQAAGLLPAARGLVVEGTGTQYFGRDGRLLTYARTPETPPYGHAAKNPIDQPEFDRMLLAGLADRRRVAVRFGAALTAITDPSAVRVVVRGPDGADTEVHAGFVVAADGGRSTVRSLLGAQMRGSAFPDLWLVIDTVEDPHDQRYAMHHGDPQRPHVVIPGRDGRCRYEFLLRDDDDPEEVTTLAFLRLLLAPYRPEIAAEHLVRVVVYSFYALVAQQWRHGNVFLAGDAAHMMPPFAGQGLNTGLRDAFNLSWKLAAAVRGTAGDALLDTYQAERRPHAEAMIDLSRKLGLVIMTTSARRARLRDACFSAVNRIPPAARYFAEMRFKPQPRLRAGFVVRDTDGRGPGGTMLPQPQVLTPEGRRILLDDVLGDGFSLIGVDVAADLSTARSPLWEALAARRVSVALGDRQARPLNGVSSVADADRRFAAALGACRGQVLLVRPDRYVVGAFAPAEEEAFARRVAVAMGQVTGVPSTTASSPTGMPAGARLDTAARGRPG